MMIKTIIIIPIVFLTSALLGCHSKKENSRREYVMIATLSQPVRHLYFSGIIQPIHTISVLSPTAGSVQCLHFIYGQYVKQGQLLITIDAATLRDDFRNVVRTFLAKKTSYMTQEHAFQESKILYQAGVIDRESFQNEQDQYNNSVLDYMTQEYQLKKILFKAHVDPTLVEQLTLTDIAAIKKLLSQTFNHMNIYAPTSGVALFPFMQNQSSGMMIGAALHESQLIVSIGDLSGFTIDMNINEADMGSVHPGMKVLISSDAFPGVIMIGSISYIALQAQPNQEDILASVFKASVQVLKMPPHLVSTVHIGMTAKVDMPIAATPCMVLPIDAVLQKNGHDYVTIIDTLGHQKNVMVTTGNTTLKGVVILSGVQVGQQVVVHD